MIKFDKIKYYGLFGVVRLVRDLIATKIFFKSALIVRYPWYVRGAKRIQSHGDLCIGINARIDVFSDKEAALYIGKRVQIGDNVHIGVADKVIIDDDVLIASYVYITDHDHGAYSGSDQTRSFDRKSSVPINSSAVTIRSNVWIGEKVSILKGVEIGMNSIIAAGAVVTKSIPPNAIAAGIPAKIIKKFNDATQSWDNLT